MSFPGSPNQNGSDNDFDKNHRQVLTALDGLIAKPNNAEEEKELYNSYFEKIYEAITQKKMDYTMVASITGLKERRVRECLLYRLGSGEVLQLFGLEQGFCYVCRGELTRRDCKEPMCLTCLQTVDSALISLGQSDVSSERSEHKMTRVTGEIDNMITDDDYQQMIHELSPTQKQARLENAEATIAASSETENNEPVVARIEDTNGQIPIKTARDTRDNDVLELLDMNDDAVTAMTTSDLNAVLADTDSNAPVRHYGFKRHSKKLV